MQDPERPTLRTPMMVAERCVDVLLGLIHEPHQNAHRVHEQRRVSWLVDVRFHHGAVDADLVPVVDLIVDGVLDEDYVDPLERERFDLLDVSLEGLLVGYWAADIEAAERPVADGVGEVERELVVAEPAELLHEDHTQHLLAAHSLPAASRTDVAAEATDQRSSKPSRRASNRASARASNLVSNLA